MGIIIIRQFIYQKPLVGTIMLPQRNNQQQRNRNNFHSEIPYNKQNEDAHHFGFSFSSKASYIYLEKQIKI